MKKKIRIDEDKIVDLIRRLNSGEDEKGPFFTNEHLKLSKEDRFAEDFILVGIYLLKKLDIKNVIRFECDFSDRSNRPLRAIQTDGNIVPLDFDTYIDHTTPRQYAYLCEAQSLVSQNVNPNRICEKIKNKSPSYLNLLID